MFSVAAVPVIAMLVSSPVSCPDTGGTLFFKADKGFQGFHVIGRDSYRSFFVGSSFEKAESDLPAEGVRAEFWVDRVLVQWQFVDSKAFPHRSSGDRAMLKGWVDSEVDYVRNASSAAKSPVASVQVFEPLEDKGIDGKSRLFQIWQAAPGDGKATQFWVGTPHAKGIVVLSLVARSQEDVPAAKAIIDSYMANFGTVEPASCQRLQDELSGSKRP